MDFHELLITEDTTLINAMQLLDTSARKILFVVRDERLLAAISDGDIRRWILDKGSLDAEVKQLANFSPKYIVDAERGKAKQYMAEQHIDALPVVDDSHKIVDVIYLYEECEEGETSEELADIPVVIMAGGLGTRLYPYTKILPKPLIPIGDIPITEHIMNRFRKYGCKDFYMIVNHKKNMIKAYFNEIEKDYNITFIDEDNPLGTGGGVGLLKGIIKTTFILTNCDSLIKDNYVQIVSEHKVKQSEVTMICSLKNISVPYGVVEIGENGSIEAMKEKPQYSFFTNTGTYVVEPGVIDAIKPNEAIGFPDVIQEIKDAGGNVRVYPINEKAWLDMGQFDSMEDMRTRLGV
ncbi:sugar phosphate nucleotidyltransferase [Lacrimispora sp.]|jgi:dTDP-glucose pyrophosphorylase|uniref:sugar phosphate nucleotidyltransferase n=1 Tax=Lacrimispora sp. TaxID=2719234 RepID=UPI0028AEFC38|nr:sugar phosphate nucleotidyltransferase [Lacrimispora sp.]